MCGLEVNVNKKNYKITGIMLMILLKNYKNIKEHP